MADSTITVDPAVPDRLATLAGERGTTIRDLVGERARVTPTRDDLDARHAEAVAYVGECLVPDFGPDDVAAGERRWRALATGRLTSLG